MPGKKSSQWRDLLEATPKELPKKYPEYVLDKPKGLFCAEDRVYRSEQLSLEDIRPGVKIRRMYVVGMGISPVTVLSEPWHGTASDTSSVVGYWVRIQDRSEELTVSLADLGVVPYENGYWNQLNWAVRADEA